MMIPGVMFHIWTAVPLRQDYLTYYLHMWFPCSLLFW